MATMQKLIYLIDGKAPQFRIDFAARCLVIKIWRELPVGEVSKQLLALWG